MTHTPFTYTRTAPDPAALAALLVRGYGGTAMASSPLWPRRLALYGATVIIDQNGTVTLAGRDTQRIEDLLGVLITDAAQSTLWSAEEVLHAASSGARCLPILSAKHARKRGVMAAHKMKDGRWCVWLDLGSDPATGQRLRKRVEARTKRAADMKATALRERHARGENITDKARTLGQLLDDWIATMEKMDKAENTMVSYRGVVKNHLKPHMGATAVPKLRARDIQKVFNTLADQFASSTVRSIKTVLVAALDLAVEQNERADNPAARIRVPAVKKTPGRSLSPDEVRAVLLACEWHRYGLAIRLALMGLRRGELPGLRWEDFDEQLGTLLIRRQIQRVGKQWTAIPPKDGSERMLSLGPKVTALLRQHRWTQTDERDAMAWENSGFIFVSVQNGGVCPPGTIYNAFKAIAKAGRHRAGQAARLPPHGRDQAFV